MWGAVGTGRQLRVPAVLDVVQQHADEEVGLPGVGHPQDAAAVAHRAVVAAGCETVAHVHDLQRTKTVFSKCCFLARPSPTCECSEAVYFQGCGFCHFFSKSSL